MHILAAAIVKLGDTVSLALCEMKELCLTNELTDLGFWWSLSCEKKKSAFGMAMPQLLPFISSISTVYGITIKGLKRDIIVL